MYAKQMQMHSMSRKVMPGDFSLFCILLLWTSYSIYVIYICLLPKILNFDTCYVDKANKIEKERNKAKKETRQLYNHAREKKTRVKIKRNENVNNILYV